jgi:NAD(P)-dependent dehydrogenase (short-subunit alcohol dehydrogenase family)
VSDTNLYQLDGWALVLGASSGFGEATSIALARAGMNVIGVHLDRRAGMAHVEEIKAKIVATGREALFFNVNAADEVKRNETLDAVAHVLNERGEKVRVLMHSLAFGTLKPFWAGEDPNVINKANMDMTLDVMAHSLVYWTQDTLRRGLFSKNGRIFGMTSAGNMQIWSGYGAVSAAKCALESHLRQLACELAPHGITANAIEAGVTDTPALSKIPGSDGMKAGAIARNPHRRLTTVEDVADCIVALSMPATRWMTGNVIRIDGGEKIAG